jgi:excisionase family DNA binding protein
VLLVGTWWNVKQAIQKRLLTLKEAATYLAIGTWKLRQMVAHQEIKSVQHHHGSRLLFDLKELDKWIEAHKS